MVSKFDLGDFVVYRHKVYKIVKIYAPNWNLSNPYVYGLSSVENRLDSNLISVREELLIRVAKDEAEVRKVLYSD